MLCIPTCVYRAHWYNIFVSIIAQSQQAFDNQFQQTYFNCSLKQCYFVPVQTSYNDDKQVSNTSTVPVNEQPPVASHEQYTTGLYMYSSVHIQQHMHSHTRVYAADLLGSGHIYKSEPIGGK